MNKRFFGVLVFAFVVSACGAWIIYRQLISHAPAPAPGRPTSQIVLAAHDLEQGAILVADDVRLADWPGPIPEGASSKLQDFLGRGVITEIYSKEPVTESRLAAKGAGGGLASMIPAGMRAFAVRVNEVAGVAGFVTAGMRVDVVINGSAPGADAALGTQARTLLQNIQVLSAGQDYKKDSEGKPVVTQVVNLLVTPEQAEKLSLAANQTSVQLILRNPLDQEIASTPGAALGSLFRPGGAKLPVDVAVPPKPRIAAPPPRPVVREVAAPVKKEAPFTMEVISGTQKSEKQFDPEGGDK
jgi:pilus assembly protein CpaB